MEGEEDGWRRGERGGRGGRVEERRERRERTGGGEEREEGEKLGEWRGRISLIT